MKNSSSLVGWLLVVQGTLGLLGPLLGGRPMGLLPLWFDLSGAVYTGLMVGGALLIRRGRAERRRTGARG
ncbi:hypothetical protein ACWD6I_22120 [Streptomyces sp. NPDC002454]